MARILICFFFSFPILVRKSAFFSVLGWSCSHVRAVIATLGGQQGAARRADKWQHLYAGFTVWLSTTEATGNYVCSFICCLLLEKQLLLVGRELYRLRSSFNI